MAESFLGEIRIFSFNFPPKGWAFCNGQFLPIGQNTPLFSLLGTTYGGNGQTTFALPNLRGQVPIHFGQGHTLGETAGSTAVTVNITQLPTHMHTLSASTSQGNFPAPENSVLASTTPNLMYASPVNLNATNATSVANVGGSQPHNNMAPYLVLNFCIALQGIFPPRN